MFRINFFIIILITLVCLHFGLKLSEIVQLNATRMRAAIWNSSYKYHQSVRVHSKGNKINHYNQGMKLWQLTDLGKYSILLFASTTKQAKSTATPTLYWHFLTKSPRDKRQDLAAGKVFCRMCVCMYVCMLIL